MKWPAPASGVVSPVTTDPLTFAGAVTFSKNVTIDNTGVGAIPRTLLFSGGGNDQWRVGGFAGGGNFNGLQGDDGGNKRLQLYSYPGIELRGTTLSGSPTAVAGAGTDPGVSIINTTAAVKALVVKGAASQSVRLQEWQDSGGVVQAYVDTDGRLVSNNGYVEAFSAGSNLVRLGYDGTAGAFGPGLVLGSAFDAGMVRIAAGVIRISKLRWLAANEQTTVGAAGGASALPATPTEYLRVQKSDGTELVVPAYAQA